MAGDILLTIFLVILNGFFVAAEFAIVKLRSSQLELKLSEGIIKQTCRHILQRLDAYLAATRLAITMVMIAIGYIGDIVTLEVILQICEWLEYDPPAEITGHAVEISFVIMTFLLVVFGVLAPKSISIRYPLATTLFVALPLRAFYTIFYPVIFLLNGVANLVIRMFGIKPLAGNDAAHTEEELRIVIAESVRSGTINTNEQHLIEKVFEFDNRFAKQVMIPRLKISGIDINWEKEKVLETVIEEGYSRMPVYRDSIDKIIGIVYSKDLLAFANSQQDLNLENIMRPVYYVPESKRIKDLIREFQKKKIHLAIVTDEFGRTVGLISLEDIIEEVFGEIYDEYDEEKVIIIDKVNDKEFTVNAVASIVDVNRLLPQPLPENKHYDTVSGLILYKLGKLPNVGDRLKVGKYEVVITKKSHLGVELVNLKLIR
ncbi:hemolysin family protein [Thermoflexibacter ruber]|uniref:Hemolysin, contains CBS domains n=1 Tax=Thermoflexibacter ruber TaxID=1003 RepID=A0A1I2A372_9BACT|nr:hemolysin family protein [Thermoflexibacter ruber]SFE38259.1 Hemolysin, contains CBS domains [Thermoflexibacter ruber]